MIKRIASTLLAATIVLGMTAFTFAAPKVTSIEPGVFVSSIAYKEGDNFEVGAPIKDIYEDYAPGDTINIFLDPTKFTGTELNFTPKTGMSVKNLENAGVEFKFSSGKNSNMIQNIAFKETEINGNRVALIQVKLADNVVSEGEKEFETTITLYANKSKQQSISIGGGIAHNGKTVDASDGYVDLSDGSMAEATENITNIEINAGKDLSLHAKMYKGKKYYAVAKNDPSTADMNVMTEYGDVQMVYSLSTQGFTGSDATVRIKSNEKMFVYDQNGKSLGTTEDNLALSSKYYLADKEVTLNLDGSTDSTTETPADGDEQEPELPSELPAEGIVAGVSTIPDTGIPMALKVATFAVVVSLGTIGVMVATGKKRKD